MLFERQRLLLTLLDAVGEPVRESRGSVLGAKPAVSQHGNTATEIAGPRSRDYLESLSREGERQREPKHFQKWGSWGHTPSRTGRAEMSG
jgi:hypothetical protein